MHSKGQSIVSWSSLTLLYVPLMPESFSSHLVLSEMFLLQHKPEDTSGYMQSHYGAYQCTGCFAV